MEIESDILFKSKLLEDHMIAHFNKQLKVNDMTASQMRILVFLMEIKKGTTTPQKEIQDYFGLKHPTVIGLLKRMEEKGLVTVTIDEKDKRQRNVNIMPKAFEQKEMMKKHKICLEEKIYKGFDKDEIIELGRLLDKLIINFLE
ncbi:MAG: MarR family transcriptional regulator [Clostridia bacterium]